MFEDLYDAVSFLWSWRWPTARGEITLVEIEEIGDEDTTDRIRLSVCYKFWIGDDGPYSGEDFWKPKFSIGATSRIRDAEQKLRVRHTVPVRYRADDPSVNRLDADAWSGL